MAVEFTVAPQTFCIAKLPAGEDDAEIVKPGGFFSMTRDEDEVTIVADASFTHPNATIETGWRAIKLTGPLPFELTGVLGSFLEPLGLAGIPVFAISTFSTDYVFVRTHQVDLAVETLRNGPRTDASV